MNDKLREELDEMMKNTKVDLLPKEFLSEENQFRAMVHSLSEMETQVNVLYRMCARIYAEAKPEYKDIAHIDLKTVCDIFGWEDFGKEDE